MGGEDKFHFIHFPPKLRHLNAEEAEMKHGGDVLDGSGLLLLTKTDKKQIGADDDIFLD